MIDCSEFLDGYSDFRDALHDPERQAAFALHAEICEPCARYHRVLSGGLAVLLRAPELTPSDDFATRLERRLADVEAERLTERPPGTSVAVTVAIALAIGAAAWLPALRAPGGVVRLAPVVAHAPREPRFLPIVFHPTLLTQPRESQARQVSYGPADGFFAYSFVDSGSPSYPERSALGR